jgi:hypothetical protein
MPHLRDGRTQRQERTAIGEKPATTERCLSSGIDTGTGKKLLGEHRGHERLATDQ